LTVAKKEEFYGRHGDIKPENVLWFKKCPEIDDEKGILQIADFGLGRFHGRESRSNVRPDTVLGTSSYEPPECKLHRPVSRAYDIWSLGCLYLEFITWLLKGSEDIEGFANFRGKSGTRSREALNDDYFFTLVKISNANSDAVVREEVKLWVNQLHEHEKCSEVIHDLLDLIMKEVLLTDASRRIQARWLDHHFKECIEKATQDKNYLLLPTPRRHKLSNDERTKSIPTIPTATQASSKKVTFTRPEGPLPLSPAHFKPAKDLVQRGPPNLGLSRSKTHATWPITSGSHS
jgi:serine/threonine protein kinase